MIERVEAILRALGDELLRWRSNGAVDVRWNASQAKSEADLKAHAFLVSALSEAWPHIPVISEEDPDHIATRPDLYWLIDPIDGTASYCGGYDGFVTQTALMKRGAPILGAVVAPALGLAWRVVEGGVAERNGVAIRVNNSRATRTLIDNYPEPRGCALALYRECGFSRYIESGSIGLKICRVAEGTADLFVKDVTVRDWDLAPAHLILNAAGGCLSTFEGAPIAYAGSMEKVGLIAAASADLMTEVLRWKARRRT
jgi:3'-phosphoadenosine 5'-phosphosulfate (PAPS) 3'-phosphatase